MVAQFPGGKLTVDWHSTACQHLYYPKNQSSGPKVRYSGQGHFFWALKYAIFGLFRTRKSPKSGPKVRYSGRGYRGASGGLKRGISRYNLEMRTVRKSQMKVMRTTHWSCIVSTDLFNVLEIVTMSTLFCLFCTVVLYATETTKRYEAKRTKIEKKWAKNIVNSDWRSRRGSNSRPIVRRDLYATLGSPKSFQSLISLQSSGRNAQ